MQRGLVDGKTPRRASNVVVRADVTGNLKY